MRLVALLLVFGCSAAAPPAPAPARAFYYWRTTFALSPTERAALSGIARLYVRMFDIGPDGELLGPLAVTTPAPAGLDIVPVVFLKNDVFKHPRPGLAQRVHAEVAARMRALGATPRELQLDCDWTESTREAYFAFLTELHGPLPLSATIRLHQVKYRERTGVPPVERGMLMFYNMGKFSADPTMRAIFDEASARKYLGRIADYPLPLDAALPIWSWVVHLRGDQVIGLLESTDPDELAALDFVARTAPDRYSVTRAAFLHGTLLRDGDALKIEVTAPADTIDAAGMLGPRLAPIARTVALFDLSERNLARHGNLDQEFRALR